MRILGAVTLLVMGFLSAPAWADETIEIATYVPAPTASSNSMDRLHANRMTIGQSPPLSFSITNPDDATLTNGTLLVNQKIGIGTANPLARLDVQGVNFTPMGDPLGQNMWFRVGNGGGPTGDSGRVWIQYGLQAAPLLVLRDYNDPPRIQFQKVGTGTETSPEQVSWIGMAASGNSGNLALMGGNVGIGTANPGATLEVNGQVKITGGTPGADKVLTSDAAGLASWKQNPSGVKVVWAELASNKNFAGAGETRLLTVTLTAAGGRPVFAIGKMKCESDTDRNPDFRYFLTLRRRPIGGAWQAIDSWSVWESTADGTVSESGVVMDTEVLPAGTYEFELRAHNERAGTTRTAVKGATKLTVMEF